MKDFAKIKRRLYREDGRVLITVSVGNDDVAEEHEFIVLHELLGDIAQARCGDLLDADDVARLDSMAETTAAFTSASASLALAPCSARGLYRKLYAKRFSKSACENAVKICCDRGYIDEVSTARRRCEIMTEKLWGRGRIFAKLYEEGYCEEAIAAARDQLEEVDFAELCMRAIGKKYRDLPVDRNEREKMFASLIRLGYSKTDIKEALRRILDEN